MKEKEFRKIVREEIKKMMKEDFTLPQNKKESIASQIYQWIIQGDMEKAYTAMQNDPTLLKLANNIEMLKKELVKRISKDDKMLQLISQTVDKLKMQKGIK